MEKDNVEKMMEEYKEKLENLESENNTYNVEINKQKLHIKRLEDQRNEVDRIKEKDLYQEYTKQIDEAEEKLKQFKVDNAKSPDKKKAEEIRKNDLKDSIIKAMTMKNKEIDKKLNEKKIEQDILLNEYGETKYDYKKYDNITDEIYDLRNAKSKIEEYLNELEKPSEEVEKINEMLKETYSTNKSEEQKSNEQEKTENTEQKSDIKSLLNELLKSPNLDKKNYEGLLSNLSEEDKKYYTELLKTYEDKQKEQKHDKQESVKERVTKFIQQSRKQIEEIKIGSMSTIITYTTVDGKENKIGASYNYSDKEAFIKEALKHIYSDLENDNEGLQKEYEKYKNADPNIVYLLATRGTKERLEEYGMLLNGEKIDKDEKDTQNPLYIEYDLRKISKSSMTKEEQKQLKDYAFEHRNIAKVKKNLFQTVEFAFRGFKERINNSNKIKALSSGTNIEPIIEEGIDKDTSEQIRKAIENKNANREEESVAISKSMSENNIKRNEENDKFFGNIKIANKDNKIEKNANSNVQESTDKSDEQEQDLSK